jgi:hypothetical protein
MLVLIAAAALVSASTNDRHYGESLLAWEISRNRPLEYAAINLENPTAAHFEAGENGAAKSVLMLPLADALGKRIGTVALAPRQRLGKARAKRIAAEISRHIYSAATLSEDDPFVAGAARSTRGQELIERELKREPSLATIAFHVALPGRDNRIIASNFGRIGKPGDADDQRVIATGTSIQEVTNGGQRLAVELPLRDRSGRTIGALSTSFMIGAAGQHAATRSALRVQQDLSRSIPKLESLAD